MKKQSMPSTHPDQFGFDSLLVEADTVNAQVQLVRRFGHLPGTMDEALPFYRGIIERHHGAMMRGDAETVMTLREEAHNLALRLNNGVPGILAGPDAQGCVLERLTAATPDIIPLWGQRGEFTIEVETMRVRIDMDGLFGIGCKYSPWMNFSAHAVDWDRPFLSETGYRSFLGIHAALVPGMTPESFAADVITHHVTKNLKGKLPPIETLYRERNRAA